MNVFFQMILTASNLPRFVSLCSLKGNDLDDEAKEMVTEAAKARGVALEM